MREIVLDTETTGFDPALGHRVVEIGCVELFNHVATGNEYHAYLNPERGMPAEAEAVHGLSAEFLSNKQLFAAIADDMLAFIGDSPIIAHNAGFDMSFINAELKRAGKPPLPGDRAIDTVLLARRKFPGAQASLDALCRRFQIDTSGRDKHGALLDAKLLAKVYLELIGGREPGLALAAGEVALGQQATQERPPRPARRHAPTAEEAAAHADFIATLKNPIWSNLSIT
ncbi:MAG: DNA polymerase III subunit epsilon [Rhodospirillaceae bacterium]|nr:DNA polymerase III subunit epsilon [Rhodospirillaceae bacterium]